MSETKRNRKTRRQGDCLVCHYGNLEVKRLNQEVAGINRDLSAKMEMGMRRIEPPPISELITVFNMALQECYLVFIHHFNHSAIEAPQVRELVKLTERCFAPSCAQELRLATPAHYRRSESSNSSPADPHDGLLTKDATPWMRQALASKAGTIQSLSATVTFSAPGEPWVYCTSMSADGGRDTQNLKARFPQYDTMTVIKDADAFAIQLGIDFAISVQKSTHVELGPIEEWVYRSGKYRVDLWEGQHPIDKIIRVYHGPVDYEDQSGVLGSAEDVVDFSMVPKGWFTKKTRFSGEREYRFAVSTLGKPMRDTFKLRISDDLRSLTTQYATDTPNQPRRPAV